MSIAATELPTVETGFSEDATLEMPPIQPDVMPDDALDLTPVDDTEPEVAATTEDVPDDDPLDPAVRTRIAEEVRAELAAKYDQDFNNLRSTKDRETKAATDALLARMAREQTLMGEFHRLLTSYGIEPEQAGPQLELIAARVDRAEQSARAQQQQQVATVQSVYQNQVARFQQLEQEAVAKGLPPIQTNDPVFLEKWNAYMTEVGQYGVAAERAKANMQRGMPVDSFDAQAHSYLLMVGREMREWQEGVYRPSLSARQQAEKDKRTAAAQKAAKTRQENRGAQHTANGGGGAGMSVAELSAKAWEQFPTDSPQDELARLRFVRENKPRPQNR
jgi:hypothetical protein